VLWIFCIPGLIFTHVGVGKLLTPIKDLPKNIIDGFDNIFKFASLEEDSRRIGTSSLSAMALCNYDPTATTSGGGQRGCPTGTGSNSYVNSSTVDTTANKNEISGLFSTTLGVVNTVANDPYFGVTDLQPTATSLTSILNDVNGLSASMTCSETVRVYCQMWQNSDSIVNGMGQVNSAIDMFKNGDETKSWEDHAGFFTFLHSLPYFSLIGMAFLTFYHYKGGICCPCCCHGGSKCACLALIPFFLFWLVAFILFFVVFMVGLVITMYSDEAYIDYLNTKPSLDVVVTHMQTKFPEFWNLVFADIMKALKIVWTASIMFTVTHLMIVIFSCCECCCRPFKKEEEAAPPPTTQASV
jgi:hypothetical protein